MAKNHVAALALLAVAVAAALLATAPMSEASCSVVQLTPCAPTITAANKRPSGACCAALKQQRPCLCGYLRNPALKRYVNSPGAKRVASACRVRVRC